MLVWDKVYSALLKIERDWEWKWKVVLELYVKQNSKHFSKICVMPGFTEGFTNQGRSLRKKRHLLSFAVYQNGYLCLNKNTINVGVDSYWTQLLFRRSLEFLSAENFSWFKED